jgi:putative copper resistance protein D
MALPFVALTHGWTPQASERTLSAAGSSAATPASTKPLILNAACAKADEVSIAVADIAAQRLSSLGIASVGTLVITGVVNSWIWPGVWMPRSIGLWTHVVFETSAVFRNASMNRLRLTPALSQVRGLRHLRNKSLMEAMLGLVILYLVGILGTLPPGCMNSVTPVC